MKLASGEIKAVRQENLFADDAELVDAGAALAAAMEAAAVTAAARGGAVRAVSGTDVESGAGSRYDDDENSIDGEPLTHEERLELRSMEAAALANEEAEARDISYGAVGFGVKTGFLGSWTEASEREKTGLVGAWTEVRSR